MRKTAAQYCIEYEAQEECMRLRTMRMRPARRMPTRRIAPSLATGKP